MADLSKYEVVDVIDALYILMDHDFDKVDAQLRSETASKLLRESLQERTKEELIEGIFEALRRMTKKS